MVPMYPAGTFITVPLSVLPRNETSGGTTEVADSNTPDAVVVVVVAALFATTAVVVVVVVSEVRETSPFAEISNSEAVVVVVAEVWTDVDGYAPSTRKKNPGMLALPSCWIPHGKRWRDV